MNDNEREWINAAIGACEDATGRNVIVLCIRSFATEPDYVVTNATTAEVIQALVRSTPLPQEVE